MAGSLDDFKPGHVADRLGTGFNRIANRIVYADFRLTNNLDHFINMIRHEHSPLSNVIYRSAIPTQDTSFQEHGIFIPNYTARTSSEAG